MLTHIHDADDDDDDDVVIFFTSFLGSPFISSPYFGVSIKFRNEHLIFLFFFGRSFTWSWCYVCGLLLAISSGVNCSLLFTEIEMNTATTHKNSKPKARVKVTGVIR